jgi:hypothetical protein
MLHPDNRFSAHSESSQVRLFILTSLQEVGMGFVFCFFVVFFPHLFPRKQDKM